jgi:hypothetical protein
VSDLEAVSAVQSVRRVPPVEAEKMAKWETVTVPDAAADVSAVALAFTEGSATVAAAQPVPPTDVRAREAVSEVPSAE